jgi:hypothetical protein
VNRTQCGRENSEPILPITHSHHPASRFEWNLWVDRSDPPTPDPTS